MDRNEINKMIEEYYGDIQNMCSSIYRKYKLTNYVEFDDFQQKAILRILKYMKNYDNKKCKPTSYMYFIIKGCAHHQIDYYMKGEESTKDIKNPLSIDKNFNEELTFADMLEYIEEGFNNLEDVENIKKIYDLIDKEEDKQIIYLFVQGYNFKEISEIVGLKYNIVRQRKSRICKKLRLALS